MKNYFIGIIGSLSIFFIGLTYLSIPIHQQMNINKIDINNLFISATLLYSIVHFIYYISSITEPNNEEIFLSMSSSISGIFNYILSNYLEDFALLSVSIIILMILILSTKLYTIYYFKKKHNQYYIIEEVFTSILVIILSTVAFSLYKNIETSVLMLGFVFIIISILDLLNIFFKNILKSKKFLFNEMVR